MKHYRLPLSFNHNVFSNKGSVLIIVMWLIMLGLILVTAIAANIRLSATTVINQQAALKNWSQTLELINKAHMELLIEKMPKIDIRETSVYNKINQENSFDGRPIKLNYSGPDNMTVRIIDLSGKININGLGETKLRQLLEHNVGEYDNAIPQLVDAWFDWLDSDDLKRLNGAEAREYKKQNLDYVPRNTQFASVAEIRMISGFDNVFKAIDLDNVFTLYGNRAGFVNPNIASKEVLKSLPGMNEQLADKLIDARKIQPFSNMGEVAVHLSPSAISKVSSWINFRKSSYYTIIIHPAILIDEQTEKQSIYAYMEEVRVDSRQTKPVVLRVNPYAKILIEQ